jgi:Nucleotidyl transferase AbiEii toxin, Type IV TA system
VLENYLRESMERIKALLVELKIPFHFTGGIAVFYYGEPRFTQDLDLVIRLSASSPEAEQLLSRLSETYLIHKPTALQAIRGSGLFQAIDQTTLVKIDFHVGEKIPGELDRTSQHEFGAGLIVPLVSMEDAILSKMIWMRLGSHKAKRDAATMWKRGGEFNPAHLRTQALKLGLAKELAEVEEATLPGLHPEDPRITG